MTVRRTLPQFGRTTIGAWCFVDHFGPDEVRETGGMSIGPHPHTGLQTVTWLFEGEVEHRDSVGSHQRVTPGQVNLMTAGRGISHSEVSTASSAVLHGVQLWVALPDAHRHATPFFEHHEAPVVQLGDARITVFAGSLAEERDANGNIIASPITTFSPLVGAEISIPAGGRLDLSLDTAFEHGVLIDTGEPVVNGQIVAKDHLAYIDAGTVNLCIESGGQPARLVLIGGEPFTEQLVMWWNFIGRSHDEIVQFRQEWQNDVVQGANDSGPFGHVAGRLEAIPAPEMPRVTLRPRA